MQFSLAEEVRAQTVTASSGGNFEGSKVAISFTVGELVTTTLHGNNSITTQGFQQPNLVITAIDELLNLSIKIEAYPNPVTDLIKLSVDNELPDESFYQLFDIKGSLLEKKRLNGLLTEISFESFVSATYFLNVTDGTQTLKTFKIIKK